jgi:hypothetical protein
MKLTPHLFRLIPRTSLFITLFLAACNLQQQGEPTPTLSATQEQAATSTPVIEQTALPTLRPTPTSLSLATPIVSVTQQGIPTVLLPGTGTLIPTVNPTGVAQRFEMTVRDGKTIGVNYEVTMTGGSIRFTLQGTDGVVWQKTLTTSETTRVEVPIKLGGMYEILVNIDHFDGNFSVSWD